MESYKHPIRIQTDHSAIIDIMKQNSIMSITSTIRINVRLIRAAQYLRQFDLSITHKPGKEHIVPDALSRLASQGKILPDNHSELDVLFTATLVQMNDEFHAKCIAGYQEEPWKRIL